MSDEPDVETRLLALTYLVQRLYAAQYRADGVTPAAARARHADLVERLGDVAYHPSDPSISMLAAGSMAEAVQSVLDGVEEMLAHRERKGVAAP